MTPGQKHFAVNFFNEHGQSVLTENYLYGRIDELEKENALLKRQVRSLALRLRASAETETAGPALNS